MSYCKQNTTITKKPFETFLFEGLLKKAATYSPTVTQYHRRDEA